MRKIKNLLLVLSLVLTLSFSMNNVTYAMSDNVTMDEGLDIVKDVFSDILDKYYGQGYEDVNLKSLFEAALKGAFDTLDPYSVYYTDEEYKKFYEGMSNVSYGLGVVVQKIDNGFLITKVYDESGAKDAGIEVNDVIVKVNNEDVTSLTLDEVVVKIKGENNTKVNITVNRSGVLKSFDVIRGEIIDDPVTSFILSDYTKNDLDKNTLYLYLDNFDDNACDCVVEAINEALDKNENIDGIILDLCDNGGGYTNEALGICSLFLGKEEEIFTLKDKEGNKMTYSSKSKNMFDKICVLINHNTASASEVTTGCLKDNKRAIVIGENSYGKNVSQTIVDRKDYKYKMTDAVYFTPSGASVLGTGIVPHIEIMQPKFINDVKYKYYGGEQSKDIACAKSMLKYLGYNITDNTDIYDANTFNLVSKFQADSGLGAYGGLDYTTQRKLNEKALAKYKEDNQMLDKAVEVMRNFDYYRNLYLK
ncbi:MAG: S41 family peptidase [Clostridia bacterium]|nr:S41 family peptidase [Clostridia bacterium]